MSEKNPVRALSKEVAQKIAAGEVIDRPASIVREFLDNALDAEPEKISVEIFSGGIEKVRVSDDGVGMTKDDLQNCARPHATSKIVNENDLLHLSTLGFRGEALSSIAAVSRLTMISGVWKMSASITSDHILSTHANVIGTIAISEGLFENFPARRKFLKRPASEALLCKSMCIEKALAHPNVAFDFSSDNERKLTLAKSDLRTRCIEAAFPHDNENFFYEIKGKAENDDWQFSLIIGDASIARTNKKDISIFVNGRKINEYSLVQAIEYGAEGYFPNGTHPVALLFVTIKSELVDFNIHPAKKEARFLDIASLHHGVSSAIKKFFKSYTLFTLEQNKKNAIENNFFGEKKISNFSNEKNFTNEFSFPKTNFSNHGSFSKTNFSSNSYSQNIKTKNGYFAKDDFSRIVMHRSPAYEKNVSTENAAIEQDFYGKENKIEKLADDALLDENFSDDNEFANDENSFHFLGSALGTFILAEKNNSLFIIDKHAAHERLLYDELLSREKNTQTLLVPYEMKTESDADDMYLSNIQEKLNDAGISIFRKEKSVWEIRSVPDTRITESDIKKQIIDLRIMPHDITNKVCAMTACKAAVKDGYILDDEVASELAKKALALPDPHCPHGRPVYFSLSREELFTLVKRT